MNNPIGLQPLASALKRVAQALAFVSALGWIMPAAAALTTIDPSPIVNTTQAKPNIMLLMDASDSMTWTHMPDGIESTTGIGSVGYKSPQCNILYYDPTRTYFLPKKADGTLFPAPSFDAAPYAGFVGYYLTPDAIDRSSVDLSARFKAYDNKTLQIAGSEDTAQPAYYFLHSSGTALNHATAPCTDSDGGTFPRAANGGGTWRKVLVNSTSGAEPHVDERQNFAIWYSFYRTRISLIKSAASLAFTPLSNAARVGFITVQPKTNKADDSINPDRYLAIGDFNSAQRTAWFAKLFSQAPTPTVSATASPAREGLARVGRHYAGKHDSINKGMTGDPLQYSCQQNFTIMTTDGYWNTQTETPDGAGLNGGPLKIDGTTKIGQADGDDPDPTVSCPLSDPYCPRPIWDGNAGTTEVVKDASNFYDQLACGLTVKFKKTFKTEQRRSQWNNSFTKTQKRTQFYRTTKEQLQAATFNTTKTQTKTKKTTEQFATTTHVDLKERYQVYKSQYQSSKTTSQLWTTSTQVAAKVYQVKKLETQYKQTSVQYVLVKSQWTKQTIQNWQEKRQFNVEKKQVLQHQYRMVSKPSTGETYLPTPSCTQSATVDCKTIEISGPTPVDPSACTAGTTTTSADYPYVITQCTSGPQTAAKTPVSSCTVGSTNSGSPDYVTSICTDDQLQASKAVASCSTAVVSPFIRSICTTPSGPNNQTVVGVATCTNNAGTVDPFVQTICTQPAGSNNATTYPNSCTVGTTTDANYVTSTCSTPAATNYVNKLVPTCSAGTIGNNQRITCSSRITVFADDYVDPATCTATGPVGAVYRTCTPSYSLGSATTSVPVASCANGTTAYPFVKTVCDNPPATNYSKALPAGSACNPNDGTASPYQKVTCAYPAGVNNQPTNVAPGACVANNGTTGAANTPDSYVKVTCAGPVETMAPTLVDPTTCTAFGDTTGAGPGYLVTRCERRSMGAPAPGTCVAGNTGSPNWIQTVCTSDDTTAPSAPCTLGTTGPSYNQVTCSKPAGPNNAADVPVASCSLQSPNSGNSFVRITCATTTTFPTAVVDPSTCTNGTDAANEYQVTTCATQPAGLYATPAFVDACTAGTDGAFLQTTCTKPAGPNNVTTPTPVASCTPGDSFDANHVKTTCTYSDTNEFVANASACGGSQDPDSSNAYVRRTCTTTTSRPDQLSASCLAGTTGAEPESVACTEIETRALSLSAPCTSGTDAGTNESVTCTKTLISGPTQDDACVGGTLTSSPYTITECEPGNGSGFILRMTSTTTTTTNTKSGTVTVSTLPVVTSSPRTTELTSCLAPTDPLVALPSPNPSRPTTSPGADGLPGCTAWPCTTSTTADVGSKNSLADVAQYYYKTDLRTNPGDPLSPNDVKPVGTGPEADKAPHQHMVTFVVGLGVSGTLAYRDDYRSTATTTGDFANIRCPSGINCLKWPVWPDPGIDFTNTDNYNNPKAIDDFWHTAVNGRGTFFSAKDPNTVVDGLGDALNSIDIQTASGAGDAASTFEPVAGNNFVYTASYQTGAWVGDLEAFTINTSTGALDTSARLWSAKDLLDARTGLQCDNRKVYLLRMTGELTSGGAENLVDFAWNTYACDSAGAPVGTARTGLNSTEQAAFQIGNARFNRVDQQTVAVEEKLVNFVRGQRGYEGFVPDSTTKIYRKRLNVLGDIVGSQPIYVGKPFARFQDTGYGNFVSANVGRTPMVYVGGNDGMLHAFDAATGQESWAVIPQTVLPNLWRLADATYKTNHQFYVDGSPTVNDVYDTTASVWRTILVGGLNAGGKGYYALDVTVPTAPKALWEFAEASGCGVTGASGDCDVGLSFGRPVITKLDGLGWVVMLTSGYNNVVSGGGGGYLYVLNAITGKLIYRIDTGVGSASTPSGLAQINNFVENTFVDNTTVRAYGGDLLGNIWRFEFGASPSAQLLGKAVDPSHVAQPITTRPEIAELDSKPIVFVGTGQLLGTPDVTNTQVQSLYGIIDPLTAGPVYSDLRDAGVLRPLTVTQTGTTGAGAKRTTTCDDPTKCARTGGWMLDWPETGERINVGMKLNFGTLIAATNVPKAESCTVGGHSWFNSLDFRTGLPVAGAGLVDPLHPELGFTVSNFIGDSLVTGFNVYKLPPASGSGNGRFTVQSHQSDTSHSNDLLPPPTPEPQGRRISWREIAQ